MVSKLDILDWEKARIFYWKENVSKRKEIDLADFKVVTTTTF